MKNVVIIHPSDDELEKKAVKTWPIWTKEVSRFDWEYQGDEECYIIEGEVHLETEDGNYIIKPGDFVTFKGGLRCVWDIKLPVKKYYNFP